MVFYIRHEPSVHEQDEAPLEVRITLVLNPNHQMNRISVRVQRDPHKNDTMIHIKLASSVTVLEIVSKGGHSVVHYPVGPHCQ